ncbi:MAG: ABC transporter substrate-binding protein [Elusimicrobiota bacterium]
MSHLLTAVLICLCSLSADAAPRDRLVVCDDVRDPQSLDPHKELSEKVHILLQQIYEGLVRFGPAGAIEPALAMSWEQIDPLTVRFHLRPGVAFHNGDEFNAEAVRLSVERLLDPRTQSPAAGFINSVRQVVVVDPHTVDIVTHYPDGILLNRLAWTVPIISPKHLRVAGDIKFAVEPVGTGPFKFLRWDRGRRIILGANGSYWMKDAPKLRELEFAFVPENKKLGMLFRGELDLVTNIPGTKTLEVQKRRDTKVIKGMTFFTAFASLNISTGPFADVRVRRAVNLAVDKEALVRYDLQGNGRIIASLSMPGEFGHALDLRAYPYDPVKAKALLKEAGYQNGFVVQAGGNINAERTAKIIASDLEKIGIKVKLNLSADADLLDDFRSHTYDMIFGGVPDPMAHTYFIQSMVLYSRSPYCISKNPEYDAMLEKMVSTVDSRQREILAQELDRHVYNNAYGIFTYQRIQTHAAREALQFTPYLNGFPYFYSTTYAKE